MTVDYDKFLTTPIFGTDGGDNVKEYLKNLLITLWKEGEGFSGKRPFGNSDWEFDLHEACIKFDPSLGKFDQDGYIDWCDTDKCDQLILNSIDIVFGDA